MKFSTVLITVLFVMMLMNSSWAGAPNPDRVCVTAADCLDGHECRVNGGNGEHLVCIHKAGESGNKKYWENEKKKPNGRIYGINK